MACCCALAASGHAAAAPPSSVMNSRRLTARCLPWFPRKDSTPRHGRLLHPSSWAERDDRDHAVENFFQGGSPKQATPLLRQGLLTARNRFRPNFRGWGLDENLKPKSPPGGGQCKSPPIGGVQHRPNSC